jgi:succinate dehydrogenase / fumarate reductase membrane anchor subunit
MAAFVLIGLYHMVLGLQEVILDYVPHPGFRFVLMLINYAFALALAAASIFALLRIVGF